MNLPTWISDNLALAALTAHSASPTPITIVLTTPNIIFCQAEGPTFSCTPEDLLTHLTIPQIPDLLPSTTDATASTVLSSSTMLESDDTTVATAITSPATDDLPLADVLADIQDALAAPVPDLAIPSGTPAQRTVHLLERLRNENGRPVKNPHRQIHLAYLLGSLQHEYPTQFRNQLQHTISGERSQRRYTAIAKRAYKLVRLVGLSGIYGTKRLTYRQLRKMTKTDFEVVLLPALQASQWPPFDSEDLVFSEGAHVTTGSDTDESDAS
jgi:hypothetical protein